MYVFSTCSYSPNADCSHAIAFDAFSYPYPMNNTKCIPYSMLSNQELQSAHVEHFGMIHYDYVYTQVQEGSKL